MSKVLKSYIQEILSENFQSHTFEPVLGDPIVNINRNCKHFQSRGVVLGISDLPGDAGKTIRYQVSNNGDTFSPGDILEKTMDQLAPDERVHEVKKFISGVLDEGIEFRELDSPLTYARAGNIKRLALCDTSVKDRNLRTDGEPQRDAYFNEYQEWEMYGRSGRRLKKPRPGQMVPGVSDACVIGFLDFHKYGDNGWYIDYMKTRGDKGGQGTASKLVDEFFKRYAKPGGMVHFGKMMRKEIGHLKDKMEKQYPDVNVIGARNF